MRFLVSGGPTHEFLDDVRYLGNPSTGAVGIAVATAARDAGHEVVLVLGPTHLTPPAGVRTLGVVSALEMRDAMTAELPDADAVVMTAAVSDYRPETRVPGKIKKGDDRLSLALVRNPDILRELGRTPGTRVLVGFALEQAEPDVAREHARAKLAAKALDAVILNRRGSFGSGPMEDVRVLTPDGSEVVLGTPEKTDLARWIVAFCERTAGGRPAPAG